MISDYALKLIAVAVLGGVVFCTIEKKKITQQGLNKPLKIGIETPKQPNLIPNYIKPVQKLKGKLKHSSEFV